ncbi:MAG TPA: class I SAM-dependent methyltransferase [Anaerolineales bacterium]|nr:class I SAM-dependent methyltransferase [Anaerolineales bacterium]
MKTFPAYDSNVPKNYYDSFGEKEWTRLGRDRAGELLYHVHMDVFRCYVYKDASVLELGAGAGMFSKELVALAGQLVVSDISKEQIAINKSRMTELGLENRIQDFLILDITNLKGVNSNQYDVVTCVGGALNYTFDKEQAAIHEMLRVTKPGGILIVGSVALFNSLMRYLSAIADEKQQFGIDATKWLMERGIQDAEHYPVENKNFLHMMKSRELDALFENQNVQIVEKRAAGIFSLAGDDALNQAKADQELWNLLLSKEIEFSKDPAYLNCGANFIYVVKKL